MARERTTGEYYSAALDDTIAVYLNRNNLSQDTFAREVMGMNPNTFGWKRRGIRDFTISEALRLCDALGITMNFAFGHEQAVEEANHD